MLRRQILPRDDFIQKVRELRESPLPGGDQVTHGSAEAFVTRGDQFSLFKIDFSTHPKTAIHRQGFGKAIHNTPMLST